MQNSSGSSSEGNNSMEKTYNNTNYNIQFSDTRMFSAPGKGNNLNFGN